MEGEGAREGAFGGSIGEAGGELRALARPGGSEEEGFEFANCWACEGRANGRHCDVVVWFVSWWLLMD